LGEKTAENLFLGFGCWRKRNFAKVSAFCVEVFQPPPDTFFVIIIPIPVYIYFKMFKRFPAAEADFDRNKILITTHPQHRDVWFWTIPFGDNTCSLGVVGTPDKLAGDSEAVLKQIVAECPNLVEFFKHSEWENGFPYRSIQGYSANVKALHGKHFALLGNAAEFIDPVFSSGVTIALHSAKLAADLLARQLKGEAADWQREFAEPLMVGVNAFRTYVDGWYDNRSQNVVYAPNRAPEISRMISAILAGYAWDTANPFVEKSEQRLNTLAELVGDLAFE
jgi:FAD-binding protein